MDRTILKPIAFSDTSFYNVSYFLDIKKDILVNFVANHTTLATDSFLDILIETEIVHIDYMNIRCGVKNGIFYLQNTWVNTKQESMLLMYLYLKFNNVKQVKFIVNSFQHKLNKISDIQDSIDYNYSRILSEMESYFDLDKTDSSWIINFDSMAALIKKKFKVEVCLDDADEDNKIIISMLWKKLKVGNEVEGYVKYESIKIYLDVLNYNIIKTQITFSENLQLEATRDESLPFAPHPHIGSKGFICFGNAKEYFNKLLEEKPKHWLEFLIGITTEAISTYNNGGGFNPYISVGNLSNNLKRLNSLWGSTNIIKESKTRISLILEYYRSGYSDVPRNVISQYIEPEPEIENNTNNEQSETDGTSDVIPINTNGYEPPQLFYELNGTYGCWRSFNSGEEFVTNRELNEYFLYYNYDLNGIYYHENSDMFINSRDGSTVIGTQFSEFIQNTGQEYLRRNSNQ